LYKKIRHRSAKMAGSALRNGSSRRAEPQLGSNFYPRDVGSGTKAAKS
jgi:hypothetical protein